MHFRWFFFSSCYSVKPLINREAGSRTNLFKTDFGVGLHGFFLVMGKDMRRKDNTAWVIKMLVFLNWDFRYILMFFMNIVVDRLKQENECKFNMCLRKVARQDCVCQWLCLTQSCLIDKPRRMSHQKQH